jgi:WD40 repeat protein
LKGHTDEVRCVAISPDGQILATGDGATILIWDVASGKEQAALHDPEHSLVCSLVFRPDGKRLAAGFVYGGVKVWDVGGTYEDTTLLDDASVRRGVAFSLDGTTLASGGLCSSEIRVWDLTSGKQTVIPDAHIFALSVTPDGKTVAALCGLKDEGALKLWDVATGKQETTGDIGDWTPLAVFSPDAKKLAAVLREKMKKGMGQRVKLWDVATGNELAPLEGDLTWVSAVVFSPNGKRLAAGEGKSIKLWDVTTGKLLRTLEGHTGKVLALAWTADGKTLASGSRDTTVRLWDVSR